MWRAVKHGPLDFAVPTKDFNLQVSETQGLASLKTQENQWCSRSPSLVTWRRMSVCGPGFEKMGVAS